MGQLLINTLQTKKIPANAGIFYSLPLKADRTSRFLADSAD